MIPAAAARHKLRAESVKRASSGLSFAGRSLVLMFLLVTFEGALRKWLSPSLTLPLIALRDAIALAVVVHSMWRGHVKVKSNACFVLMAWSSIVISWGLLQLALGGTTILMFLIGTRFWLLYICYGVVTGLALNCKDFRLFVKVAFVVAIAMAPLAVHQHLSPPGSLINRQVGSDDGDVFLVAAGVVRVTGTFSFTLGFCALLALLLPLTLSSVLDSAKYIGKRWISVLAFSAVITCTAVSGSRAAIVFFASMVSIALLAGLTFLRGKAKSRVVATALATALIAGGVAAFLPSALQSMSGRFQAASQSEDAGHRIEIIFLGEREIYSRLSWVGAGLGRGSNLASSVLGQGQNFSLGEAENGRVLAEGGLIGWLYLLVKLGVVVIGIKAAATTSRRTSSCLPILIWAGAAIAIFTWSAIGQLTEQAMLGLYLAVAVFCVRPSYQLVHE